MVPPPSPQPPKPKVYITVTPGRGEGVLPAVVEGALEKLVELLKMFVSREERFPYSMR